MVTNVYSASPVGIILSTTSEHGKNRSKIFKSNNSTFLTILNKEGLPLEFEGKGKKSAKG